MSITPVKEALNDVERLIDQEVELLGSVAYLRDKSCRVWLFDPASGPNGPRIDLFPDQTPDRRWVFREVFVGSAVVSDVGIHTATVIVAGRLSRASRPDCVAELIDLRWATLSYKLSDETRPGLLIHEELILGRKVHPRLAEAMPVACLLENPAAWSDRRVRVGGYLVRESQVYGDPDFSASPAVLVAGTEDLVLPERRIVLRESRLEEEIEGVTTNGRCIQIPGYKIARGYVLGRFRAERVEGQTESLIVEPEELCLAPAFFDESKVSCYQVIAAGIPTDCDKA